MALTVIISPTGASATVSGDYHSTQIVGLEDAERWVAFYERAAKGKYGRFYRDKLVAFREARDGMKSRSEGGGS